MKKLKEKIEKILKKLQSGYFKDYPAVGSEIQITSEELEVLFKQQMKEEINKIEKLGSWEEGNYELVISHEDWKSFRKKLLKNIWLIF